MIIKKNTIISKYINIYDIQKNKIAIPIFQRFYSWKEKELIQFKEDFLKIMDDQTAQFYLLDFIYYVENDIIKLADGQQRIVTLNNLIKAIKDVANEMCLSINNIELFDISYDVFANELKYQTHMNKYVTAPFKKVYLDMYDFVKKHKNRINDMIYIIKNNIYIYMKECENADDAFAIFQQINTGGKPLSKDEVIKTALDQYAEAYQINFDTSKMKMVKQSLISFYKFIMPSFDKNFDNMEIITFLREYVTKDKKTFQNFVNTSMDLSKIANSPLKYVIDYINRQSLNDVLNILAIKGIDIDKNQEYREKVVIPLCMMSIILTLNGGSPTTFKYLLTDVINDLKTGTQPDAIRFTLTKVINNDKTTWTINKSDFVNKLGDISTSKGIKKALLIIDVILKNVSGTLNVGKINLEHIYPQNPDHEWAANGWPPHKDDQKKLIDNIGNYLLLSEEVNKSIQNKYITHKVVKYNVIINKDKILQTPINTIDFAKFENDRERYIYDRQDDIAQKIYSDFPLCKVLIK